MDLMVYSLPDPNQEGATLPPPSGRAKLLGVAFLCVLPMILSFLAYQFVVPHGRTAAGELILPVQPMPAVELQGSDGKAVALASLKGQWLLLGVGEAACAEDCMKRRFLLRQLRETLGKDKDRVDRVWVQQGAGALAPRAKDDADLALLGDPAGALVPWLSAQGATRPADYLYVVDPLGNLMMRFPAHFDSAGASRMRRDLERLLRASLAWDLPGR